MKKSAAAGLAALAIAVMPLGVLAQAQPRNADANAMLFNGAYTKTEFVNKLQNGDGRHSAQQLQREYGANGVTMAEIQSPNTVDGSVTKSGNVLVNGQVVATGARSFGRCDHSSCKTTGFFVRSTSVSFLSPELPAFVAMDKNHHFQFALVKSCGNLVNAMPKIVAQAAPTKTVVKTVTKTAPAPAMVTVVSQSTPVVVNQAQAVNQTQNQVQTQEAPPQPTPTPEVMAPPAPTPQPVEQPVVEQPVSRPVAQTLPSTGSSAIALAGLLTMAGGFWYYRRSRLDLKSAHLNS